MTRIDSDIFPMVSGEARLICISLCLLRVFGRPASINTRCRSGRENVPSSSWRLMASLTDGILTLDRPRGSGGMSLVKA